GEEQRTIPSAEFLTWMLNGTKRSSPISTHILTFSIGIGSDEFGSFVKDYFRHVSKPTLKYMGLSLLCKTASPSDSVLYTVCVNAVAYKFLATILMTQDQDGLSQKLWQNALEYRKTAQASLKEIRLLTTPSLALLQAILCGVSLSCVYCPP